MNYIIRYTTAGLNQLLQRLEDDGFRVDEAVHYLQFLNPDLANSRADAVNLVPYIYNDEQEIPVLVATFETAITGPLTSCDDVARVMRDLRASAKLKPDATSAAKHVEQRNALPDFEFEASEDDREISEAAAAEPDASSAAIQEPS